MIDQAGSGLSSSLTCDWTRKCSSSVLCTCVYMRAAVCVSEMCDEDLQSWGWTDLCVPPVVFKSMWLQVVCLQDGFI